LKTSRRKIQSVPLSFSLYQRAVHPELFRIYRQFEFCFNRFSASVWVTRHSHVLTVSTEAIHITELITLPFQPLPAKGLLAKLQLNSQKEHTHVFVNGVKYKCRFDIKKTDSFEKKHKELKIRLDKNSKLIEIPELATGFEKAFSFIQCAESDNKLNIQTQHSRCERNELIITNTTIDLGDVC